MNIKRLCIFILLVAICGSSTAQKRKAKPTKRTAPVAEVESPEDKLYASMLPSTAKIMFIDSMVVAKDSFLTKIPLNSESGKISSYQRFFNKNKKTTVPVSVYINEFGDQAYYAEEDTINGNVLYRIDWLGEKWGTRSYLDGIGEEYKDVNYPFVMSDGITLFFAAKGENSVGGYDIFTTTFDSESGKFYEPQNYGFPFNSKANDYFLAIDEFDNLGWLVSDRNQPEGMVCIYTFEPPALRQNFENDNLTETQLKEQASINNIANTWKFGNRQDALLRLKSLLTRLNDNTRNEYFSFVINDNTTYHHLSDFKSKANRQQFLTLNGLKASLEKRKADLQKIRDRYATETKQQKARLTMQIVRQEQEAEQLYNNIKGIEKKIRNTEIQLINK